MVAVLQERAAELRVLDEALAGPQTSTRSDPAGLTARQREILALEADGLTDAEIAARLVLSVRTVDHHVFAVLTKLGVTTRREARHV